MTPRCDRHGDGPLEPHAEHAPIARVFAVSTIQRRTAPMIRRTLAAILVGLGATAPVADAQPAGGAAAPGAPARSASSDPLAALAFRSVGPAVTSGRIAD